MSWKKTMRSYAKKKLRQKKREGQRWSQTSKKSSLENAMWALASDSFNYRC